MDTRRTSSRGAELTGSASPGPPRASPLWAAYEGGLYRRSAAQRALVGEEHKFRVTRVGPTNLPQGKSLRAGDELLIVESERTRHPVLQPLRVRRVIRYVREKNPPRPRGVPKAFWLQEYGGRPGEGARTAVTTPVDLSGWTLKGWASGEDVRRSLERLSPPPPEDESAKRARLDERLGEAVVRFLR